MRDLGELTWFLKIRIIRDRAQRKIWLCQDAYIEKITKSFHLENVRPAYTPLPTKELTAGIEKPSPQDIYAYQHKVGSILYAALDWNGGYASRWTHEGFATAAPQGLCAFNWVGRHWG